MTSENRGCHWHEQQQRWRVVFRVNGKQKQFGQFETLEEAQKRSDEVWPTLPIAQRSVKTCNACGITGRTGKEFHWNQPLCKECGRKTKRDPWNMWCRKAIVSSQKRARRNSEYTEWKLWSRNKQTLLINRGHATRTTQAVNHRAVGDYSWDEWLPIAIKRWNEKLLRRRATGWERKTKQWASCLIDRKKKQHHKQN